MKPVIVRKGSGKTISKIYKGSVDISCIFRNNNYFLIDNTFPMPTLGSYVNTKSARGIDTGVYPTKTISMEIYADNFNSSGDINIGMSDGSTTWDNPDDNSDWRLFKYNGSFYWDRGSGRSHSSSTTISHSFLLKCSWNSFSVYNNTTQTYLSITNDDSPGGSITSGRTIWIEPLTSTAYYANYHYIKIFDNGELIRHYVPYKDNNGKYCFLEVLSQQFCYPLSGSYTGSVTIEK